jgi:hypothetical protein
VIRSSGSRSGGLSGADGDARRLIAEAGVSPGERSLVRGALRALARSLALCTAGTTLAQHEDFQPPAFQPDPGWPTMPNDWVLGEVSSVAAGPQNRIWVLHRPGRSG